MSAFSRSIVAIVLAAAVAAPPALAQGKGGTKDGGQRKYYLTKSIHFGSHATEACEPGFHMASIWELVDIGSLRYDKTRGYDLLEDAGQGPPASMRGWVRTGVSPMGAGGAGYANCHGWIDSGSFTAQGSMVWLEPTWTMAPTIIAPWRSATQYCSEPERVWCVQD